MPNSVAAPPLLPGYAYVGVLGSGGFSDVFLYQQEFPKRRVAVKVLTAEGLTTESRHAFTTEANVMAQLSTHPYIVTIFHAAVSDDGRPYFVMEYCSGPSLADRYKARVFTVAQAVQIGIRLSSAIATAHYAGILHRDIKPANVLTNDFGWPALTDFGIASVVDEQLHHTTTMSRGGSAEGGTGGTASVGMSIPWSPPEMFDDDPEPDARSDVFSLAATIYTLLAGRTPFEAPGRSNGTADLIGRIVRGAMTPLGRDDVPRSLVAVLNKGMANERGDRFASAADFARALQRVEAELGYAATSLDIPISDAEVIAHPVAGASGPDETRARSVSTIRAQTPQRGATRLTPSASRPDDSERGKIVGASPAERPTPSPASGPSLDRTVARSVRTMTPPDTMARPRVTTSTQQAAPADELADQPVRSRGARSIVWWAVGAIVIAVGVAVAVNFVVPKSGDSAKSPAPVPHGQSVIDNTVTPDVAKVTATAGAAQGTVEFVWVNPNPQAGDTYGWTETQGPNTGAQTIVQTPKATVGGFTQGSKLCISVVVIRNGSPSANPVTACFP